MAALPERSPGGDRTSVEVFGNAQVGSVVEAFDGLSCAGSPFAIATTSQGPSFVVSRFNVDPAVAVEVSVHARTALSTSACQGLTVQP